MPANPDYNAERRNQNSRPTTGHTPPLTLQDIQAYVHSYLRYEYFPNSKVCRSFAIASGLLIKRSLHLRWLNLGGYLKDGVCYMPTEQSKQQAKDDLETISRIFDEHDVPTGARQQLFARIMDRFRLHRFSRIHTKLTRAADWPSLAAHLYHDKVLLLLLCPNNIPDGTQSYTKTDSALDDINRVNSAVFERLASPTDFYVRRSARFWSLVPGRRALAERAMARHDLEAFRLRQGRGSGQGNGQGGGQQQLPTWRHFRREKVTAEEIEVGVGEILVRRFDTEVLCPCGVRHETALEVAVERGGNGGRECLPDYEEVVRGSA